MFLNVSMKCGCCGTTAGPWWLDRTDGVLCVACAGWVAGFYALMAAFVMLCRNFAVERLPADTFYRIRAAALIPWAPCPARFSQKVN